MDGFDAQYTGGCPKFRIAWRTRFRKNAAWMFIIDIGLSSLSIILWALRSRGKTESRQKNLEMGEVRDERKRT